MALIQDLITWTEAVFLPFGPLGIFIVAFLESSFFPIPPDLLLIPLVLADPSGWILYASVATAGSVAGALLGYAIGIKGGRPVLLRFAREEKVAKMEGYFGRYGDWAIAIAGFTPIPYKIFTIAAGVFRHSLPKLILVSAISRGARFFAVAGILTLWGAEIVAFFDTGFGLATLAVVAIAFVGWYGWRKIRQRRAAKPSL